MRNDARNAHTAGYSWRKWEDPIQLYRRPWEPDIRLWLFAILLGLIVGLVAVYR